MTAPLEVTDLRKQFAIGRPAIDCVSFSVPAGEIVVLLGPSGCGKTTTLRCVAGLEHPTGGEIAIGGKVVSSPARGILVPPRSRDLGMVFQSYAVWPHMTVRQNVIYPLKHRKIARGEADRKVDEALELVGLSEYADRPVVSLSGGQMQRVALARSIVYRPQLLLLDEPLSNLDAKLRLRLRDDLRVILKQTGITALYVTHDQAEAVVLGDRIGVMRDGKLLQIGTPDEIYNRPADLFVANFTGATNELPGTLVARNGGFGTVDFGDGRRAEAALLQQQLAPGDKVRIALRPENIAIGRQDGANAFTANVVDRRYQGTQTIYDIDLFGHRLEALELGTAARHAIGAETPVCLPKEACWAFRDSGPSSYD
jgi:iron(III) transport system ATP-binding protein